MLQLSPCGQSTLQPELLSNCKHILGLSGSVDQATRLSEVGLQPLQVIWAASMCEALRYCLHCSRGNSLLWKAIQTNVELSEDCHKAWCARLLVAWFLNCIGELSCDEMDMCNLPNLDMVVRRSAVGWEVTTPTCGCYSAQ
jgi:hypothetical protein